MVGLAIPTSFMVGFLLVALMEGIVNIMLLFGLGADRRHAGRRAIVLVEFADRKMAEGVHRQEAYIMAAKRMFWPTFLPP